MLMPNGTLWMLILVVYLLNLVNIKKYCIIVSFRRAGFLIINNNTICKIEWSCTAEVSSFAPGIEFSNCRDSLLDCKICVSAHSTQYTWLSWEYNEHCWGMTEEPSDRSPSTTVTLCSNGNSFKCWLMIPKYFKLLKNDS